MTNLLQARGTWPSRFATFSSPHSSEHDAQANSVRIHADLTFSHDDHVNQFTHGPPFSVYDTFVPVGILKQTIITDPLLTDVVE